MKFQTIGRLLPRSISKKVQPIMDYAGLKEPADIVVGLTFLFSAIASIFASIAAYFVFNSGTLAIIVGLVVFGVAWGIMFLSLALQIESRRKAVDEVLADFLQLSAANVRAGMTIDRALWYSARPEFGLLSVEIEEVARKTFGGRTLNEALTELSGRFKSKLLTRAVKLIIEGIQSGGEMADLLERVAWDLRSMQLMQREIAANVMMYVIFIIFAAGLGAPLLFSLSLQLLNSTNYVWHQIQIPTNAPSVQVGLPLTLKGPTVSTNEFYWFAVVAILLSTTMSALIVAVIQKGNMKAGVRLIPFFVALGIAAFLGGNFVLDILFKSLVKGI